eukprot:TRINITY_DN1138_c0_g1_i1.p1 TRINITY_DN1138_c0_g1~~TRINITY_DN1138_c0_g1_i1.p1  ORF type:complete len:366 (-),score=70.19 TRINITY_DN1138_c0_g1_i1:119-1165(-)
MAFLGTLLAQAALLLLPRAAFSSVHDKVASRNTSNASESRGITLRESLGEGYLPGILIPPKVNISRVNVSEEENISEKLMLFSATETAHGSGQHFFAKVCAALNCHRSLPLSNVHSFGEAAVGKSGGTCVVVFRGTANIQDVMQDTNSYNLVPFGCSACRVGAGFVSGYDSVAGQIKGALHSMGCHSIAVTGHSLGAAKAVLGMYDLARSGFHIDTSYVFGEPRVGNGAFQASFHSVVHASVFRVVHGKDPIVNLGGPGASAVGREIYEAGNSPLTDHLHYAGVAMTTCMPDGVPGGAAAEGAQEAAARAAEHAAHRIPGGEQAEQAAERAAEAAAEAAAGAWTGTFR